MSIRSIAAAFLLLSSPSLLPAQSPPAPASFAIKEGDRVLLLGDALLERENSYGYFETLLQERNADRHFTVRNLSWSGETPRGWSRASFDPPEKGFERLKASIAEVRPSVAILGFGMAATLQEITDRSSDVSLNPDPARYGAEPMSAARFKKELGELMDAISLAAADGGVRFILLAPLRHEDLRGTRPGLPDPAAHNALLAAYTETIRALAQERGAAFISLTDHPSPNAGGDKSSASDVLTIDGIHAEAAGYRALAERFAQQIGLGDNQTQAALLPAESSSAAALRGAILRKNELFFNRFRPANETYIFGFRKHEQGQNAKEIPMYDPLIAQAEAEIDRLKRTPGAAAASGNAPAASPGANSPIAGEPGPLPSFTVDEGCQIELWAQNPLLEKPTQMNWDPQGRLWVCSSSLYPMIEPGQTANDKILVLEDPDHTGKATRSTVFAQGLLIPTGVAPDLDAGAAPGKRAGLANACYVGQSTELLYFSDPAGTGKATEKRIVFSGFGTEDTHHIVHTLHWGPDGRLYFHQSVYIHTHLETPWGMVRLNAGGVFAYDPRTERVEVFAKGLWNTWGQQEDQWGQSFLTDGAGSTGLTWAFPGSVFAPSEGARRTMASISPSAYPKFCSLELVRSPQFPADWQGNAITCDFRAHRIVRFGLDDLTKAEPPRAGYVTRELPDLVRTSDQSFRPIDVRLGPDGALYVADWSNPVINHGEVDFRDPRRDHHMGRIWRITRKGVQPGAWTALSGQSDETLFAALHSPQSWERSQAREVLKARFAAQPESFEKNLSAWASGAPGGAAPVVSAERSFAWILLESAVGHREAAQRLAESLAGDPGIPAGARAYAVRFLSLSPSGKSGKARELGAELSDPDPRVRVEAMRALARLPAARHAGEAGGLSPSRAAALLLDSATAAPGGDPHYDFAAWITMNDLAQPWVAALASGEWPLAGHEKQLEFALKSIEPRLAGTVLSRLFSQGKIPLDGSGPWIELIGEAGGPVELQRLLDGLLAGYVGDCCENDETRAIDRNLALPVRAAERAVAALQTAVRVRDNRPAQHVHLVTALLHAQSPIDEGAARLAGLWRAPGALQAFDELIASSDAKPPLLRAVVDGLRSFGGPDALRALQTLTEKTRPVGVRTAALAAMAQVNLGAGLARAVDVLPSLTDDNSVLAAWRGLLAVKGAADAAAARLAKAEVAGHWPPMIAAAGLRAAREAGRPGAALLAALTPYAGTAGAAAPASKDYAALADRTVRDGDPAKGEFIYRRAASACVTCHAIGGAGGKVGPDLTSLGASAPLDYIIESVLDPAAKVKEGFNAVAFALRDGTQAVGIPFRETAEEIFYRDVTAAEKSVAKAQIASKTNIGSIMPAGLTAALGDRERLDLFAFLHQLGRPGPYDASKSRVARVWRLYPEQMSSDVVKTGFQVADHPGMTSFTLVDGRFPRELLTETASAAASGGAAVLAATRFQASGRARLRITGATQAWLDGHPFAAGDEAGPELANGVHTLVVKLPLNQLPPVLQVESADVTFVEN